jgi:hypothetical protein
MSVALSNIVMVFEMEPLAATSAIDAVVAGMLSAPPPTVCRQPGSLKL